MLEPAVPPEGRLQPEDLKSDKLLRAGNDLRKPIQKSICGEGNAAVGDVHGILLVVGGGVIRIVGDGVALHFDRL